MDGGHLATGLFGRWLGGQEVPVDGFRWVGDEYEVHEPEQRALGYTTANWGPWLVPTSDELLPRSQPVDVLNDPRRSGFHRVFAKLADGNEANRRNRVLRFANHYGHLDNDNVSGLVRVRPSSDGPDYVRGEAWRVWENAIYEVATAVKLWDMVRTHDKDLSALVIAWRPPHATIGCIYRNRRMYEHPQREPDTEANPYFDLDDWRGGAGLVHQHVQVDEYVYAGGSRDDEDRDSPGFARVAIEAARMTVYQEIERHLAGKVAPILSSDNPADFWYMPLTLHAAVYLHLAQEITGRARALIPCANPRCTRYFEPAHGRQAYCEEPCRKQAYYYRKPSLRQATRVSTGKSAALDSTPKLPQSRRTASECHGRNATTKPIESGILDRGGRPWTGLCRTLNQRVVGSSPTRLT
jgi:hypothetical protein